MLVTLGIKFSCALLSDGLSPRDNDNDMEYEIDLCLQGLTGISHQLHTAEHAVDKLQSN